MSQAEIVQRYFDAWNAHDAEAIVSTFAKGGTYIDPSTPGPLEGAAIGANAAGLWAAFPDLSFETTSHIHDGDGVFAAQWTMRGTNTAPFSGLPPTGRSIELRGADFMRVGDDGIQSVEGYFSPGAVPQQLGMQVVVQPNKVGPFTFGISTRVGSERTGAPGAFSITSLEPKSPEDGAQISEISRDVAAQMMGLEGFMGWVGVTVGNRMVTVTAWAKPEDSKQLMRLAPHQKGARGFFGNELSAGGWVSVWTPERIGTLWMRCGECGAMLDSGAASGTCECGATVPEPRPYW